MTVLPIRTVPDPVLRTPTQTVGSADVARLVADMTETMHAVRGVGLAAPQVGVGLRLFVFDCDGVAGHVLDPVLETEGEDTTEPGEGCLSVPGLHYRPPRAVRARVTGRNVDGEPVAYAGEGLLARCLQHEVDHLDGMLFVDRLVGDERREARRRMNAGEVDRAGATVTARRSAAVGSVFGRR